MVRFYYDTEDTREGDKRPMVMIFEKQSTRTRLSFEIGMQQLGGSAVYLNTRDTQLGRGEAIEDAKRIVADAHIAADRIRQTAAKKAEESIKRREAQAKAKIAAAEAAVVTELRTKATSLAISASKELLASELDAELGASMIDESLTQITATKP